MNGHHEVQELLLHSPPRSPPPPPPGGPAAAVRGLQTRLGWRAESRARVAVAAVVAWVARGFEATMAGRPLPGPARLAVAAALMPQAFRLWPPTTAPRV
jgi:hypothetical protein